MGSAIADVCGEVDGRNEGVLAGTVRDSSTGVVLDRATVALKWQILGDEYPGSAAELTNEVGFYVFCHAPGGVAVDGRTPHEITSHSATSTRCSGCSSRQSTPTTITRSSGTCCGQGARRRATTEPETYAFDSMRDRRHNRLLRTTIQR